MTTLDTRTDPGGAAASDATTEQICVVRSVELAAPAARVFSVQSDIARWTEWHPDVSYAVALGPHRPGSVFEWVWRGTSTRTRVLEVVEPTLLVWSSLSARGASVLRWELTPAGSATTLTASLRFAPAVPVPRSRAERLQERSIERWFEGLVRALQPDVLALT
ncbi:MAG TPA: SRPBCC family protein [Acidimicrobiia bacterium]|nr:SRPBCC family protein [Acidimicrobiia bacterium]